MNDYSRRDARRSVNRTLFENFDLVAPHLYLVGGVTRSVLGEEFVDDRAICLDTFNDSARPTALAMALRELLYVGWQRLPSQVTLYFHDLSATRSLEDIEFQLRSVGQYALYVEVYSILIPLLGGFSDSEGGVLGGDCV